jgi:hypothetical protein
MNSLSSFCLIRGSKKVQIQKFGYQTARDIVFSLEKDSKIYGLTRGQFSLLDLIIAILEKVGKADVICCTWSAGIKDAKQMALIMESGYLNSFKVITDHSYVTRQAQYAVTLDKLFGTENIATSDIHAKFTLIENNEYKILINTSMNLNANKTCENFEITEGGEIYSFYKKFVDDIFDKMPKGFTSSGAIVNTALNSIFSTNEVIKPIDKPKYIW